MERKRKLPPRAAARVEQSAKKRAVTPSEASPTPTPSSTSAPAPASVASQKTPAPPETPVPEEVPLPKSIQAGHPLPTVENAQPEDLSSKEFQSVQESGVLAESLSRSRQTWTHEGIFEKYWTKPTKRKGVVKEEPNNPPKDSMTKIGQVTITIEPHVLEATMYAVKDTKPPTTNSTFRPIMQYGPPNGVMPPPPKPKTPSTPVTPAAQPASAAPTTAAGATTGKGAPSPAPSQTPSQPQRQPQSQLQSPAQIQPLPTGNQSQAQAPVQAHQSQIQAPVPPPAGVPGQPRIPQSDAYRTPSATGTPIKSLTSPPPRGLESVLAAPQPSPAPIPPVPHAHGHAHTHVHAQGIPPANMPQSSSTPSRPLQGPTPPTAVGGPAHPSGAKPPPAPAAKPPPAAPGADPIIVTLAERASEDPHLRDLMKRVAVGDAAPQELAHFQRIIDQITVEYKKKGGQQGPSADRLLVGGKKVKYFADEVSSILDIVLSSNPKQKSTDLKAPSNSDPLVILLVKKALDDDPTRELVRRIAQNKTKFHDATELKDILDKLKDRVTEESKSQPAGAGQSQPTSSSNSADHASATNGTGTTSRKSSVASAAQQSRVATPQPQQALRSKGPPPALKPDVAAVVLEFPGGSGDRYLFPKYSILEQTSPSQIIVSFLIVRKGSKSEYGGDPALDYYQPVTVRVDSHSGKHLEYLAKVVAPEDEVKRYMDDVMDSMTRAEYVTLAMRLPRDDEEIEEGRSETPKAGLPIHSSQPGVLWNTKPTSAPMPPQKPMPKVLGEDEQYQNFIATIS